MSSALGSGVVYRARCCRVSRLDRVAEIKKRQPALEAYVGTNVEGEEAKKVLILLVLAMDELVF